MSLIISGVIDGALTGGLPKAIEVTATADIANLSIYGLASPNNGNQSTGNPEFDFPTRTLAAGASLFVAFQNTAATGFSDFFGALPDFIDPVSNINGDDAIELYENGILIDVFGVVGQDGTGTAWEYQNGWAYRNSTATLSTIFDPSDWTFSGVDALVGETLNSTAASPFPVGSYTPPVTRGVIAAQNFDGGAINLIFGFDPATENLDGGPGDFFGVADLETWPQSAGVPFQIADDTLFNVSGGGIDPSDTEGIFGLNANRQNDFFAIVDTRDFGLAAVATWTFDVAGFEDLTLSIDMGSVADSSFGGYSDSTSITFDVSIDGGPSQRAFSLAPVDAVPGGFVPETMDNGNVIDAETLLAITGDNTVTKAKGGTALNSPNLLLDRPQTSFGDLLDTYLTDIDGFRRSLLRSRPISPLRAWSSTTSKSLERRSAQTSQALVLPPKTPKRLKATVARRASHSRSFAASTQRGRQASIFQFQVTRPMVTILAAPCPRAPSSS